MRGYASFLLVLASLAVIITLLGAYSNSKSHNLSDAIELERAEQLSLEAKRSMLVSAKYGAIAGFLGYLAEISASQGAKAFDPQEARERVKDGAYAALAMLDFSDQDYQIEPWCGEVESEAELRELAERSLAQEQPLPCQSCHPISSPECRDFIQAGVDADQDAFSLNSLSLGSANIGGNPKIFGITIYSAKFNIAKVSYIPTAEKPIETPFSVRADFGEIQ